MEYFGIFAFVLVICYLSKVKRLARKIKRLETQRSGESPMSKLIEQLVGKQCRLVSEQGVLFAGKTEFSCEILDCDQDWVKIRTTDKKGSAITRLMRLADIEAVQLCDPL